MKREDFPDGSYIEREGDTARVVAPVGTNPLDNDAMRSFRPELAKAAQAHEESDMSDDNKQDDEQFEAFRAKIEAVLKSLPTDDDRERFVQILAQLAAKIDAQAITKRNVAKSVRQALDGLSKQVDGDPKLKALFDRLLADVLRGLSPATDFGTEVGKPKPVVKPPSGLSHAEPDSRDTTSLADWVRHVIIKAAGGWVEQRGVREFDGRLKAMDDARAAIDAEPAPVRKADDESSGPQALTERENAFEEKARRGEWD